MTEKLNVLLIEPNKKPCMVEIDHTLKEMQRLVGGYIEAIYPFEDEVAIICNEEGKFNGMTPNRALYAEDTKDIVDIIVGPFFIVSSRSGAEDFESLPEELQNKYTKMFYTPEFFVRTGNKIFAVPFTEE